MAPIPIPVVPETNLQIKNVGSEGSKIVLECSQFLSDLLLGMSTQVIHILYDGKTRGIESENDEIKKPNIKTITVIFEEMPGVAYTTSSPIDESIKEIHVSTNYITSICNSKGLSLTAHEIHGVLVHEAVHVWQFNGKGTCPGGLIEGIADYVRLKSGLAPSHWNPNGVRDGKWDSGYERTGFFLDWIEKKIGGNEYGFVRSLNQSLTSEYSDDIFKTLTGSTVDDLWKEYTSEGK